MREKQIKHYFNVTAIGFFAYALLLQFLSAGTVLLLESLFPSQNTDSMYYAMSITVLLCLGFLSFLFRHSYKEEALENREAEPVSPSFTPLRFLHYFFLFCGAQWVSALLTSPLIFLFEKMGMDLTYSEMAAKGGSLGDFPMLFYTILLAPLVEETVFRHVLYKRFRSFGRFFTAFATSFFFALIHSNFLQFIPAFLMGFVLFSIRDRYGLPFSILLHTTNNAVAILVNNLGQKSSFISSLYGLLLLLGTVYGLVYLIKNRKNLPALLPAPEEKRSLALFFRSPFLWIDILILVALAVLVLVRPGGNGSDLVNV